MDIQLLQQFGVSASSVAILVTLYRLFQYVKGRKLVSECCGKRAEVGIDIRNLDSPIDGATNSTNSLGKQAERPSTQKVEV